MSQWKKAFWLVASAALVCSGVSCGSSAVRLSGTGATFPEPLYSKWFQQYSKDHQGIQVSYQGQGSGQGVKAIQDHTYDFGASDVAMNADEIAKVEGGVQLLPMTAGSIVIAYQVEGVKELKLTREALAGIFLGKITRWNDTAIASANADAKLPDAKITVCVRSEASGTTGVFTKHLSAINADFKKSPGEGKKVNWSADFNQSVGNPGVISTISSTPNSIGYVEFSFARDAEKSGNVHMAMLQNMEGEFVLPTAESGKAALAAIELPENLIAFDSTPAGKNSYPIVTYTWIICYKNYSDAKKAEVLRDLFTWCATDGQKISEEAGYIPLPESTVEKVKAAIKNIGSGGK